VPDGGRVDTTPPEDVNITSVPPFAPDVRQDHRAVRGMCVRKALSITEPWIMPSNRSAVTPGR
jgi:hypothetical protein